MEIKLRQYQQEAVNAVWEHLSTKEDNPCVVLPTGAGKAICLAELASQAVKQWNGRVLILAHVKELLEQNAEKVKLLCPEIPVGIYSAGLKLRQTKEPIIVAGIQSVAKKACELGSFDLIIIDECHLIPENGDGQYRTFLNDMKVINPNVRIIGLTATPYRLSGGLICKPENFINHICYEVGVKELIAKGYLSKLTCKGGKTEVNLSNLHVRAGEFITNEVAEAMDRDEITKSAISEVMKVTKERKAVIIFAMTIEHAEHIAKEIESYGYDCAIVTGDTNETERKEIVKRIKGEKVMDTFFDEKPPLKYLVNVGVFTTGFDAPNIDCVVLLRATLSPGLFVQMVGRGFRLSPQTGKTDCLVLDFGENFLRHGPVDNITVKEVQKRKENKEREQRANAKYCPQCNAVIDMRAIRCDDCGFVFPVKITSKAAEGGILSGETSYRDFDVLDVMYFVHKKKGASEETPSCVRVEYRVSLWESKSEYICPEHTGYARIKFEKWWSKMAKLGCPMPENATQAIYLAKNGGLMKPNKITIKTVVGDKFTSISNHSLPKEKLIWNPPEEYEPDSVWSSNSPEDLGVNKNWNALDEIPF